MTRGIDLIPPGSRVRVAGDILAGDPANSDLIGREGDVGNEDCGTDVTVTFAGDPTPYRFDPSELRVITPATDCPHNYRPTDSCPVCDAEHDRIDRELIESGHASPGLYERADEDEAHDGVPSWELDPAPAEDPNPRSADGWAMHAIAAHAVREGDLLPLETWNRVTFVHDDHEGSVQIGFTCPDGRDGSLQIVAAAKLAVLRQRSPDGWCAHHGEDWMDTDPEPYCHGCVEAGVTTAPAGTENHR